MNATKETKKQELTAQEIKAIQEQTISEFLKALKSDKSRANSFIKAMKTKEIKTKISCETCLNSNSYHFAMNEFSDLIVSLANDEQFKKLFVSCTSDEIQTTKAFKDLFFNALKSSIDLNKFKETLNNSL